MDAWKFTVAEDAGCWIIAGEGFQQLVEGMFLLLGTSVGWHAVFIQTSFIDYAKGTTVIALGMDTLNRLWQQGDNCPVITNIVVVATLPVLVNTTFYQFFHAEGLVAPVSHAVNDDVLNGL